MKNFVKIRFKPISFIPCRTRRCKTIEIENMISNLLVEIRNTSNVLVQSIGNQNDLLHIFCVRVNSNYCIEFGLIACTIVIPLLSFRHIVRFNEFGSNLNSCVWCKWRIELLTPGTVSIETTNESRTREIKTNTVCHSDSTVLIADIFWY